jgi:hypothetical protein
MSNLKEALAQDFIFLHGDKKYSKEHQFIACERSRKRNSCNCWLRVSLV